jgi:hypothetical protein
MSDTNTLTDPQPNAPSVDPPAPAEPEPAPEPAPAEPAGEEKHAEEEKPRPGDRRFAVLTAKLSAAERVQAQQAAELEHLRAQQQRQPPGEETPEQAQQRFVAQIRAQEAAKLRAAMFHREGAKEFPDWQQRCADLMAMGADAGFAALLVDTPDGVKLAAALAQEPEVVERIASLETERGRAIALGKFAATLEQGNGAARAPVPAPVPVTRAPAPISPVTGRASPQFDEYRASAQELVDHYLKPTPISVRR